MTTTHGYVIERAEHRGRGRAIEWRQAEPGSYGQERDARARLSVLLRAEYNVTGRDPSDDWRVRRITY